VATREERLVENQRTFRDANERLQKLAGEAGVRDGTLVPFLCECADGDCLGRVEASMEEYERAHLDRDQYVIVPGHPTIEGEKVVERVDRFETVRKREDDLWIA
jgi:hypothetical protein